ncbi:LysE family translocator [Daejeonella lutea]|uniref:Threonine/homoserine/homoserine lactone efflux protein n=1 Tax=Daejeonella lutea TaxID=572036 RepID=A0A1T5A1C9_9SPHI|nr:LysE family translocator [Daejeonella lutea]SKB28736.1 Threonine/homoserine/homoserine lactone efflux protein [Daejeonella lutea]
MIESIISGIGLGFVLSFLTGPVFFALIKTSIEKGFYAGVSLAAGVVVSDIFYVALTLYGSSFLALENTYRVQIGVAGSTILFAIGIYYLFKKVKVNYEKTTSKRHNTGYFLKGFLMCIFNPAILLYWLSVTSGVVSISGKIDTSEVIPFFGSILVTQFSVDVIKAYYANKLRYKIKEKTISNLNRIAGVLILIFAVRLLYNLLTGHSLI